MGLFDRWRVAFNRSHIVEQAAADEARFCEAYKRFQDACARKDTRAQHDAWTPLRDAQTARLNRALGWRGTR